MLRNDEIIALNVLKFAERWRLQPCVDIRWNEKEATFSTFILDSFAETDSLDDDTEYEINSFSDLNLLLATEAEFYRNVTTLVSIGALEAHDISVESLVKVFADRIENVVSRVPYPYSLMTGKFSPSENLIYEFDLVEESSGRLALEAIKAFNRTGDWWGTNLEIRHVDKEWSNRESAYVPSDNKRFMTLIVAENAYRFACYETVKLTWDYLPILTASVDDVVFNMRAEEASHKYPLSHWVACLFCERSGDLNDQLDSYTRGRMPSKIKALFPAREAHLV